MTRVRVLECCFGDGDMLRRIALWAARRGIAAELVGVDLNPRSERAARLHTPPGLAIRWVTGDYADLAGGGRTTTIPAVPWSSRMIIRRARLFCWNTRGTRRSSRVST